MRISFFEEFPIKENLSKLNLINFPTKLYLAAKSLTEFNQLKSTIRNKQVKEIIYWPILDKKEGYWISPFSKRKALLRILNELNNQKVPVMLDLELPTTKNPSLYLTQSLNFLRNKKLISNFIQYHKSEVSLAEYYPNGKKQELFLKAIGIHYNNPRAKIIKMIYHSMHNFNEEFLTNEIRRGINQYKDNFIMALGTITVGIQGNEPILSPQQLQKDINLAKTEGVKEVIIFRLGGLNAGFLKILENY
jgi:hypothetical protein